MQLSTRIFVKTSENVTDHVVIPMYIKVENLRSSAKDCALYNFIEWVFHLEGEFFSGQTEKSLALLQLYGPQF